MEDLRYIKSDLKTKIINPEKEKTNKMVIFKSVA